MNQTNDTAWKKISSVILTNIAVFIFVCIFAVSCANQMGIWLGNAVGLVSLLSGLACCITLSIVFLLVSKGKSINFCKLLAFLIDCVLLLLLFVFSAPLCRILSLSEEAFFSFRSCTVSVLVFAFVGLLLGIGINALIKKKPLKIKRLVQLLSAVLLAVISLFIFKAVPSLQLTALAVGLVQPFTLVFVLSELANGDAYQSQAGTAYESSEKSDKPEQAEPVPTVSADLPEKQEAQKTCLVHFERKNNLYVGTAVHGQVYIDGKPVGSAANGASFDVELTFGSHSVAFESQVTGILASDRGTAETLTVPNDAKRVNVEIKVKQDVLSVVSGATKLGIGHVEIIR